MEGLSTTVNQLDQADICRILYPRAAEFFSIAYGTFSRVEICYTIKQTLVNLKGLKSYSVLFGHSEMKLEISSRRKFGKFTNNVKIKLHLKISR